MLRRSATRLLPYWALAWAACSSAPEAKLYQPGEMDKERRVALEAQLKEADRAYRSGEGFERLRDQMAQDPVAACFLTRMLVFEVIQARERREVGDVQMMRAAAGMRDAAEKRAVEQMQAMGAAAAPCLVEDLLKHRLGERRELGVELLGQVGPSALPCLQPLLADADPKLRRWSMRAVAAMPFSAATRDVLVRGAADADFGVRSEALRGFAGGGAADQVLLQKALVQDPDPLPRRSAAQALAGYRSTETAAALIEYLERCGRERDTLGKQVAQEALQALSGARGKRTPDSWRSLFEKWHPDQGG